MQDDDVGFQERGLFGGDIEAVVGVEAVQAADFRLGQGFFDFVKDGGVRDGGVEVGVAGDDQDVFHKNLVVKRCGAV